MFNSEIISIVFRIINFAIIIFFFLILYKRYIHKYIKDQILKQINYLSGLKESNNNLLQKSLEVNKEIIFQENLTKDLNIKIKKWKSAFDLKQKLKTQESQIVKQEIENKLKIKEEYITLNYLKNEILTDVINRAGINLKKEFESEDYLEEYKKNLIEFLKKESI